MISERNNICVKSKALIPEDHDKVMELLIDLDTKP